MGCGTGVELHAETLAAVDDSHPTASECLFLAKSGSSNHLRATSAYHRTGDIRWPMSVIVPISSALSLKTDVQNPKSPSELMMSAKLIRCQSRCHRAVPGKEPRREGHLLGALRLTSSYDVVFLCRWCISRYFSCLYVWVPVTCPYRSVRTVSLKYGNNPVGSGHYWVRGGW